jgi:hypothetical protein
LLTAPLLVALASCATASATGPNREAALTARADALFQLRSRGCEEGGCPVYSVAIYTDGAVIFDGGSGVKAIGRLKGELANTEIAALVDAFHRVDFIDTPEHCCDCPEAPKNRGAAQIVVDYRPGGVEKEIVVDELCGAPSQSVRGLIEDIEGLALVSSWIGRPPTQLTAETPSL